ncbi:MAG: AIPR family protein [Roseiarcus sp.]
MSETIQSFLDQLRSDVDSRALGGEGAEADYAESAFVEHVTSMLADEVGIVENPEVCHFQGIVDRGLGKINGYAIGEDAQDEESIDLFVAVYGAYTEVTRIDNADLAKAAKQAVRFFTGALGNLYQKMDPAKRNYHMAKRIHEAAKTIKRARLFILTDGQSDFGDRKEGVTEIEGYDIPLRIQFWDISRMSNVLGSGAPQKDIEINVVAMNGAPLPCVTAPVDEDEYRAYLTIVPGTLLRRLYEEHGSALLQKNVRSFLQAKGKVNRGIRDSLRLQPHRFLAYNNGISLTADKVETSGEGAALAITRITGLQIVNGGQTTVSIHRAGKDCDLSRVFVQAKLVELRSDIVEVLAPKIAEYANTQNPIQMADFSANDPFHVELERLSRQTYTPDGQAKWFYERARGQYQVELAKFPKGTAAWRKFEEQTKHRRITKLEIAKYLTAWEQIPNAVSLGGQKNFVQFTQRMRDTTLATWKPDERYFKEAVAKAILFTEAARLVGKTQYRELKSQFAGYLVACLSYYTGKQLDLSQVWRQQRISLPLENLIIAWIDVMGQEIYRAAEQQGRSPSEWCKRPECWRRVQRLDLPAPVEGVPEFERMEATPGGNTRVALSPDELDARQRCRQVEPDDWVRIVRWGANSGVLSLKQREIAADLATAAAGGWLKEPPPGKAIAGREIINLAIESSVLESDLVA